MRRKRKYDSQQIYNFIVDFKRTHDGVFPTYREIMAALDISSLSIVNIYIDKLTEQGLLAHDGDGHLLVVGGQWTLVEKAVC